MKPLLIVSLFSLTALTACSGAAGPVGNSSNRAAASPSASEMPRTEASNSSDDFVDQESGTAKAQPAAGKANVQGKVLYNGQPAANIEVKLCKEFSRFVGGCKGETFKSRTDATGEYLIADVTPGIYEALLVRVFNTDSYVFATKGIGISSAKYKVDEGQTFFAPDTNLFKDDLKITVPKADSTLAADAVSIGWDAYPDAAYYKLDVSPQDYDADSYLAGERVETNQYTVTKTLKPGKYTANVTAYNAGDVKLADADKKVEFTVK